MACFMLGDYAVGVWRLGWAFICDSVWVWTRAIRLSECDVMYTWHMLCSEDWPEVQVSNQPFNKCLQQCPGLFCDCGDGWTANTLWAIIYSPLQYNFTLHVSNARAWVHWRLPRAWCLYKNRIFHTCQHLSYQDAAFTILCKVHVAAPTLLLWMWSTNWMALQWH